MTLRACTTTQISPRSRVAVVVRSLARLVLAFALVAVATDARADNDGMKPYAGSNNETPPELDNVDVVEHLGGPLPREALFRDTAGNMVRLGDFFDGKRPVALVFAYHTCPMLCTLVLDGFARGVKGVDWTVGDQYDVIALSIDPRDTPAAAAKKQAQIVEKYGRAGSAKGWHFLVGDENNIRQVTNAVGFQYHYDERQQQYAHPAAMYLVTPEGNLARYLYGIEFASPDIRLGLLEASQGRSISTVEKLILYCYHYDPAGKRYALVAMNVMRVGGGACALLLLGLLGLLWLRERRRTASKIDLTEPAALAIRTAPPQPVPHVPASNHVP